MQSTRIDSAQHQHEDEGWWLVSGKVSWDVLFRHHRPDHPIWTDRMHSWGCQNPQLGKFLIGLSVNRFAALAPVPLADPSGARQLDAEETVLAAANQLRFKPDYDFRRSVEENRAAGRVPPPELLAAGRRGVLAASLVAGALFWWLARSVAGEPIATLALLLWLANPALADHSVRAMIDLPALVGALLGLAGAIAVSRHDRMSRAAIAAIAVSAFGFALGVATKLNVLAPLIGALLVALGWSVHDALRPSPSARERRLPVAWLWALALVVLPIALTFASNPLLWNRPWTPIQGEPDRLSLLFALGDTIETYSLPGRLPSLPARIDGAARFLAIGSGATIGHRLGFPFEALLASVALFVGVRRLASGRVREGVARGALVFAAISAVTWSLTIAWLPFDFERFYLPLLPAYLLAAASGAHFLARKLAAAARLRLSPPRPGAAG